MKPRLEKLYLAVFAVFTLVYLVWRVGWTLPKGHGALSLILALILLLTELIGMTEMSVHFLTVSGHRQHRKECPAWEPGELPDVDVLVPTYGEPAELLEQTLRGCLAMEYDDPAKVHIYLCDDADRSELRKLCAWLGVGYFARCKGRDAKAGNLNNALQRIRSPLVAVFDADMRPQPGFLLRTVPYFLGDKRKKNRRSLSERIGFVQTPQVFRNADLFQRAFRMEDRIPNEQDYFYRNLEPARNKLNSVIFGGSNTLLSRRALDEAGGFVTGTLTEDFATGIEIQKRGYVCFGIDEPLAVGLCPESLQSMIRQRGRWARGCIQSGRKTKLLTARGLTLRQRLSYLAAVIYWYAPVKRLVYLSAPLLYAVFGVTVMACDFTQMLMFWLPMYLMAVLGIRLFSEGIRTARWSDVYELCFFPFLLWPVAAETVGFHKKIFAVTDKSGQRGWRWYYPLPFLLLIGLSVLAVYNVVGMIRAQETTVYLFLLFWLVFNLYELLHALVFVLACRRLPPEGDPMPLSFGPIRRGTWLTVILWRLLFGRRAAQHDNPAKTPANPDANPGKANPNGKETNQP